MTRTDVITLALLVKVSRQLDRVERDVHRLRTGQEREERLLMKIQDVLDAAGVSLSHLEEDDAALIAALTAIQEAGGTLTDEQVTQANAAIARIDAIDQADKDALAAALATQTPVQPGSGDAGSSDTLV
jgi:hypothetical protein